MVNSNILSQRYATQEIDNIFSPESKVIDERDLWLAVMKGQKELGVNIPSEAIEKFEAVKEEVNLSRIKEREKITGHDVKARIEEFVAIAKAGEYVHLGMTSRDPTDNVEQMQFKKASQIIFGKYVSVLRHLIDRAIKYAPITLTARSHHQAAQPTLLGRRFSMWAEELYLHLESFEGAIENYPLRGIKGPVGTQADMLTLLGSEEKVAKLEEIVASHLGFKKVLTSPGQIYPRSLDLGLVSHLSLLSAACESFSLTMRLMAGYDLVTEGFKEGQVGSSAMPHKMNTKNCERIWSLAELIKMYADGASRISGSQWEEGDVSDSALRRVVMPDAFYASDGLCETTLTVLNAMGVYPVVISQEVDKYLPFLATGQLLTLAVQQGIGREQAHKIIKKHSVAEALKMREVGIPPALAESLAKDTLFKEKGITKETMEALLKKEASLVGAAFSHIKKVSSDCAGMINRYMVEASYEPREIL